MEKVAVYCGTRNVYEDMLPSVKSLLCHTRMDRIYFLIEDDEFPYPMPPVVEFRNVSNQKYFKKDGPNYSSHWTYMALMRVALSKEFPKLDRVLSLDNDTIIKGDVSELWDLDLTDYYFAGAREPAKCTDELLYCNFGVVMLNLEKMRKDKMDTKVIRELNKTARHFPEQDTMSIMCKDHILEIPPKWNVCDGCGVSRNYGAVIRHYAGEKNWRGYPEVGRYWWMKWSDVKYAKG